MEGKSKCLACFRKIWRRAEFVIEIELIIFSYDEFSELKRNSYWAVKLKAKTLHALGRYEEELNW